MIPTQTPRTSAPSAGAREDASLLARIGAAGPVTPRTGPGRSTTSQMCGLCHRSGPAKVTISMGDKRFRLCGICASRGDKTTELKPVDCAHPFARHTAGAREYSCIDCFEPVPAPVEAAEGRCTCDRCREAGGGSVGLVLVVAVLGIVLAGLAGQLGSLIRWLPLLALLVAGAGWYWRLRARPFTHDPRFGPWYGPVELDPHEARPTLPPVDLTPVPAQLLESVLADARCQRDRERGEAALLAAPGTPLGRAGDARASIWAARNAGLVALLDWAEAR